MFCSSWQDKLRTNSEQPQQRGFCKVMLRQLKRNRASERLGKFHFPPDHELRLRSEFSVPVSTPYGVYQVVITDLFSELSCSNTFFGTTREFNEDHAASFRRPNDYIWSFAGCTNVWRKDYLFVVKVDEQLPIVCARKKSLFWLGLAFGGLFAFPNKTTMKIFAGCFGTWCGCSLVSL